MQDCRMKLFLLSIWNILYDIVCVIKVFLLGIVDKFYTILRKPPIVVDIESSIRYIISHKCSVARYGDGEMKFIKGEHTWFQPFHPMLQKRLEEILKTKDENLIVCIPGIFGLLDMYAQDFKSYWYKYIIHNRRRWYRVIDKTRTYYEAFVSRCYLPYKDKSNAGLYFQLWKQLWKDRDVLIVEGEKTRFGVGNDLLEGVHSVKRILAPNTDAFSYYDELLTNVKKFGTDVLVLLALGPTATVMAADLSTFGYQAIDIGHLDIEYEWFLKQVDNKIPIEGKFVNEAGAGVGVGECENEKYINEIVWKYKYKESADISI